MVLQKFTVFFHMCHLNNIQRDGWLRIAGGITASGDRLNPMVAKSALVIPNARIVPIEGASFDGGLALKARKLSELDLTVKALRGSRVVAQR